MGHCDLHLENKNNEFLALYGQLTDKVIGRLMDNENTC